MARSAKITTIAVIILSGGGLGLITGASALTLPKADRFVSLTFVVIGVWGLATGIGLLRLQRWARLSVLIFVCLTTLAMVILAPVFIFSQPPPRPNMSVTTEVTRTLIVLGCLPLIGLGMWCAHILASAAAKKSFGVPSTLRPASITVIGWYLVVVGLIGLAELLRIKSPPLMAVGFVFVGRSASFLRFCFATVSLYLGFGLLRRDDRSRRAAIYYGFFLLLDTAVFLLRPDQASVVRTYYNARLLYDSALAARFPLNALSWYLRLENIDGCILTAIALWFLVAHKSGFTGTQQVPILPEGLKS